ncbi:MAG TPA: hypothetical protein DCL15_01840 [Chloroflexi bacterium]|nr:hypothetical protein [Chloroflexota bacterium]
MRMTTKTTTSNVAQEYTWRENPDDIIVLANRTNQNFILDLPAGRYRLDAGRRMRTLRSILKHQQIMALVEDGSLAIE